MWRSKIGRSDAVQVTSSHLITTFATMAAIILFVVIGANVVPGALGLDAGATPSGLVTAFLLNIAIILFGWTRAKDLAVAMTAVRQAEEEAHRNAYADCVTGLHNLAEEREDGPVQLGLAIL